MSKDAKRNPVRISRRVECALMPDIYGDQTPVEKAATRISAEVPPRADRVPEFDNSAGFNPYDTGVLYKK